MSQLFQQDPAPPAAADALYADVALEQGIDLSAAGLTYRIPPELSSLQVGQRVRVPLGRKNKPIHGFVMAVGKESDLDPGVRPKLKSILARDEQGIAIPPDLIELARWMAGYYCCPIGMVLATMLPAAVKRGTGRVLKTLVSLAAVGGATPSAAGLDPENPPANPASAPAPPSSNPPPKIPHQKSLSPLQLAVLAAAQRLAAAGQEWVEPKILADEAGAKSVAPVKQLVDKGLLVSTRTATVESGQDALEATLRARPADAAVTLNKHQQAAVDRLAATVGQGFAVHLLHGVTGSGKTEVYLRLIEHLLAAPPQHPTLKPPASPGAIILVPEISLTPQTVARFLGRFDGVAVLHSGLSAAQRHLQWRRIADGQAHIVVGARSAIFAPLPAVGVIIVDEEQEPSYKQDQLPRYHARDVAVKRGQLLGVPVILGSATPSFESYYNATERRAYHLLELPERISGFRLPKVEIVDMVEERRHRRGVHLLSQLLENQLAHALRTGGQAMLLLNRRGYANYIACPDHACGWMMACEFCDATMVYHKDARLPLGGLVRCHHCDAEQLLPQHCPVCGKRVTVFGLGTQRVEEEVLRKFPELGDTGLFRMDSDAMRTAADYTDSLDRFRSGRTRVLVGTQMIAKGLDFPNVAVVGVVSGDTALHMPDFRAAERTYQLIAQVSGRAGRSAGSRPATVVVQTFNPHDVAIGFAARHDYAGFAAQELAIRKQVGLPPVTRMARIVVRDKDQTACYEQAALLAGHLEAYNLQLGGKVRLRGPAPCPIARVAEYHRQQIELIAPDAAVLQKLLTALRNARLLHSDARTAVDVDPVDLL